MNRRSLWKPTSIAALILGGSYVAASTSFPSKTELPSEMTASVVRGSVEETVLALGTLEPSSIVRVGAQVTGQIISVHARNGQTVKPGDLLVKIDATPQQNALRIAEAKVKDMDAQRQIKKLQIRQAESDLTRQRNLSERDVVARMAFEEAETKYATLKQELVSLDAQIEQSRVALETAQANLAYTRITAPMAGKVVALPVEMGQTLNSAQTSPTVTVIANLETMLVKIRISEADVWRTHPGQGAWFTIVGDPTTRYAAVLEDVEYAPPSLTEEATQSTSREASTDKAIYYHGVLRVKNSEGKLRPKMTAQVRISVGRAENVLLVPWAALSSRLADGRFSVAVRRLDGGTEERYIRVGFTDKVNAEVKEGLQEGESVVLKTSSPPGRS